MSSDAVGSTKSLVLRFKIIGFVLPSLGAGIVSSDGVGSTKSLVLRFKIAGFVLPSLGVAS